MESALNGGRYEIVVAGHLPPAWSEWFEGFEIETGSGETRLMGAVADQPALHGILARLRDLGIPILSISRLMEDGDGEVDLLGNTPPGT